MTDDCLFCQIVEGKIPANKVKETETVLAFEDINPAAPTHVLVIPKEHVGSAHELGDSHGTLLSQMFTTMAEIASERGVTDGYRIVTNVGRGAGQSVFHIHFHLIAGRELSWPPG